MPLLSVCIPTYNRRELLVRLLRSIAESEPAGAVEVVIVDDGSDDGTPDVAPAWRAALGGRLTYLRQVNAGRASALRRAILESTGDYIVPMDSDDYFLPGWLDAVRQGLEQLGGSPESDGRRVHSLIFRVAGADSASSVAAPALRTNLLAFRADRGARGDMKEVVEARAAKASMYQVPAGCRRVPTSLLWARMAQSGDSLFIDRAIARKDYLPGGMTAQIRRLKVENPQPIMELNQVIADSRVYASRLFRLRAMVQWARYALHSGGASFDRAWKLACLPAGATLYAYDRMMRRRR